MLRLLPVGWTVLALLAGLFADASAVVLLGASAWLITSAAFHPHLYVLTLAITGVRAAGLGRAVFRYLDRYLSHRAVFTLLTRLRLAVYDTACARLPERQPGPSSGTFLARATAGIDELRDVYLRALFPLVRLALLVTVTTSIVAHESSHLAAVPLLAALLLMLLAQATPTSRAEQAADAAYRSHLLDIFAGRADLVAFSAATSFTQQRLDRSAQAITAARRRTLRREAVADACAEALPSLAWWALFLALAAALPSAPTQAAAVHLAVVVLVLQTLLGFFAPLTDICRRLRASLATARAFGAALSPVPSPSLAIPSIASAPMPPVLAAQSVSFSYGNASSPVFTQLSFSVRDGEKLVLFGESGAGKTTLFHLLARLWTPDDGAFFLRGRPYAAMTVDKTRAAFAAATQAGYVFSGSIRANFRRLLPSLPDALRQRALSIACCDAFLAELPHGEDTMLGEDGVRLSGGQRQRLLVALAVGALLADPSRILLLDEPTTGLDERTATQLLTNLLTAFPSQTMLLILHDRALAAQILARSDARALALPSAAPPHAQ